MIERLAVRRGASRGYTAYGEKRLPAPGDQISGTRRLALIDEPDAAVGLET